MLLARPGQDSTLSLVYLFQMYVGLPAVDGPLRSYPLETNTRHPVCICVVSDMEPEQWTYDCPPQGKQPYHAATSFTDIFGLSSTWLIFSLLKPVTWTHSWIAGHINYFTPPSQRICAGKREKWWACSMTRGFLFTEMQHFRSCQVIFLTFAENKKIIMHFSCVYKCIRPFCKLTSSIFAESNYL